MAIPSTYYLGPNGFYYRKSDSAGPFAVDGNGNPVLVGGGSGAGVATATNGDVFRLDGATTISYNADNTIAYIQIASGSDNYRQTWTWTSGNLTAVSGWVKQ